VYGKKISRNMAKKGGSDTVEVKIVNSLFVGIDVGSQNNAVYLMKPDGEKHSSFSIQNNRSGDYY